MADKKYAPVTIKEKDGKFGKFLSFGCNAEKLKEFITANTKPNGFFDGTISTRKEVGKYGETHSFALDDFRATGEAATPKPF